MRSTSASVVVLFALCCLGLCQGSPRSKRTKLGSREREHCQLSSDPGSCDSKLRRWFYDSTTEDCKTFFWTGCDGNDNRFRSRGLCERSCKGGASAGGHSDDDTNVVKAKPTAVARCRRLPCKGLRCHHGYERGFDDNGCHTCQCRSMQTMTATVPLVEVCPQVDCPGKFCPRGFQFDDRGCLTCQCLGCPALSCPSRCHDGYVVDEQTGCERCECTDARDSGRLPPDAAEKSPVGQKGISASEGRELLKAVENSLPATPKATRCPDPPQCFLQCSDGFAVDAAGCELCACRKDEKEAPPDDALLCRPVECQISCQGGYAKDEIGCEICTCARNDENKAERKRECPKTACAPPCALKIDGNGCPVCVCNHDDVIECDRSALVTCSLYCPGGFDRDSHGCEICECRPLADEKSRDGVTDHVTCAPFDEMLCAERCELFLIRFDDNGCERCECVGAEPEFTTPALEYECPALFECTIECPEALERDERGCEICVCRQPEVDDRLVRTGDAGPEVTQGACPAIECPLSCRMEADQECPRCICDGPNASHTVAGCPEVHCVGSCTGGHDVDDETGCPTCDCADNQLTGSAIVVTSDPLATLDSFWDESLERNPTPFAAWSDSMPEGPTTMAAPITDIADPERSRTTTTAYPAEVMCSRRGCSKNCINGLRRNEGEECFICECQQESRSAKRLVDVSVSKARQDICSLPVYTGPCHAALTRWNFNSQTGTCETFVYGGCRGYANNFQSKESCIEFCVPEVNQERAMRQKKFNGVLGF